MLKEFLNAISGPVSNVAFTYPNSGGVGGPTVSRSGIFNKLLNTLSNGSFGGGQTGYLNGYNMMQGQGQNNLAAQAYANSLAGGQNFNASVQRNNLQQAFSPGSVVNTLQAPPSPQGLPSEYSQVAQLATIGNNPLQGFAGAAGAVPGAFSGAGIGTAGLAGGAIGAAGLTGLINPSGATGVGNTGFGKLSMLLMPLVGLVSVVKSLFGLRGFRGMQPVTVDKEAIDYKISLENYQRQQHAEGSFDDYYWDEEEYQSNSDLDLSKLEM